MIKWYVCTGNIAKGLKGFINRKCLEGKSLLRKQILLIRDCIDVVFLKGQYFYDFFFFKLENTLNYLVLPLHLFLTQTNVYRDINRF